MTSTDRNIPIDIAKGISILLVAFGHSQLRKYFPELHDTLSLVRMPLFFFLSGVFFQPSTSPKYFLLRKTNALLKPYFVTLAFVVIYFAIIQTGSLTNLIGGIFYGNGQTLESVWVPMWFLPHLWLVLMLSFVLYQIVPIEKLGKSIVLVTIFPLLLLGAHFLDSFMTIDFIKRNGEMITTGLPFSLDIIPITLAFFIAGNTLKDQVKSFRPNMAFVVPAMVIFALILVFTEASMDLNMRIYLAPLWATIGAISGIYLLLSLSYYLSKSKITSAIFSACGYSSLFILIFHAFINFQSYKLSYLGVHDKLNQAIIAFILGMVLPVGIKWIVERNVVLRTLYLVPKRAAVVRVHS